MRKLEKREVEEFHKHIKHSGKKKHYSFLFRYKYKKMSVFIVAVILAYWIFSEVQIPQTPIEAEIIALFLAGIALAFGFLAPFATGYLIALNPESIVLAAVIASIGTVIADVVIFKFIKLSFLDEFQRLKKSSLVEEWEQLVEDSFPHRVKIYIYYSIIGLMIASPLPDEIGIAMMAGLTKIKQSKLIASSYALHFIGCLIILSL